MMTRSSLALGIGRAGVTAVALASIALPARGSLVMALTLDELVWRADRVVVAEVLDVRSSWDERREQIRSRVDLRIVEAWKGGMPADYRISVEETGGTVDGITMRVIGAPRFVRGERSVLFLRGPAAAARVVGMAQGKRGLRQDAASGRWIAEAAAGVAATVSPDPSGRLFPAPPDPARPLDELRAEVLRLSSQRAR